MQLFSVIKLLFLVSLAKANTESLILAFPDTDSWHSSVPFLHGDNVSKSFLSPDTTIQSTLVVSHLNNRELETFDRNSENEQLRAQVLYFKIEGYDPKSKYNLRVCWPATFPILIDLSPKFVELNEEKQAFLEVTYYPKYYSSNQVEMLTDLQVPLEVHMVSLLFGVIPIDIQPVIALIITVAVIGLPMSAKILEFIRNSR